MKKLCFTLGLLFLSYACKQDGFTVQKREEGRAYTELSVVSLAGPSDGYYSSGQRLEFIVTFSGKIQFSSAPRLPIELEGSTVYATADSLGPAKTITFSYTTQSGDYDQDGISVGSSLDLNGGKVLTASNGAILEFQPPDLSQVYITKFPVYYVSASGDDSNDGLSPQTAWQSITKVNSINFAEGETILFKGGEDFTGELTFNSSDVGSASHPLVLGSYGEGRATIRPGPGYDGIDFDDVANFIVRDLIVVGSLDPEAYNIGIHFENDLPGNVKLENIAIQNVDVSGFRWAGVAVEGKNGESGFRDITVTNLEAHDNLIFGFYASASQKYGIENIKVSDSKFYDNRGMADYTESHSGNGIVFSQTDGGTIERCLAYNNGENNSWVSGGPVGIWAWDSNNILIQHNESYGNKTATKDGGGFDFDGGVTNSVMQYNYSHDNDGAGYLVYQFSGSNGANSNNVIRYNISVNDGRTQGYAGILLGSGQEALDNIHIYHNTIFMDAQGAAGNPSAIRMLDANITNSSIRNNIISTKNGAALISAASDVNETQLVFQGNNYFAHGDAFLISWAGADHASLGSWTGAVTDQEKLNGSSAALNIDPVFKNPGTAATVGDPQGLVNYEDYQISQESLLIDAGIDLVFEFGDFFPGDKDFYGRDNFVGAKPDVGAHEAQVQ